MDHARCVARRRHPQRRRVEVPRGPQGTLFGRNATSGVVNFITARPDLSAVHASASAEIGNYKSRKLNAMSSICTGIWQNSSFGITTAKASAAMTLTGHGQRFVVWLVSG